SASPSRLQLPEVDLAFLPHFSQPRMTVEVIVSADGWRCVYLCHSDADGDGRPCSARGRSLPGGHGMPTKTTAAAVNGAAAAEIVSGAESLPADRCLAIYRVMVRTRAMEERMIKMSKSGEGYFWIGGPGEEAFNTCLGMQVHKGRGPAFDYLH